MAFVGVEFVHNGGVSLVHAAWLTPLKKEVFWPPKQRSKSFIKVLTTGKESVTHEEGNNINNLWKIHKIERIILKQVC